MVVRIEWATPQIDTNIAWMARVSNPNAKPDDPSEKLIGYLIDHKHWSPFEMANICLEIETTRDIGRQLLRHRSLHFQELSQRYAEVGQEGAILRNARIQDTKNRQNSFICEDEKINVVWTLWQNRVWDFCYAGYTACLKMGIAKEQARALLPEGLTQTRMFVNGTVRDWFHYLSVRLGPETQLEHRQLAQEIHAVCMEVAPAIFKRLGDEA